MDIKDTSSPPAGSAGQGAPHGGGLAAEAKEAVSREVQDARARLSGVTEGLRGQATEATGAISSLVSEQAERRKEEAADGLRSFAEAIRRAADEMGGRDSTPARLAQEAAHGLESLSGSLQSRSVNDMSRSLAAYGREHPATFLAGCVIAGVALGRFLIASGARAESYRDYGRSYGDQGYRSYGDQGYGDQGYGDQGFGGGSGMGSGVGAGVVSGVGSEAGSGTSGYPGARDAGETLGAGLGDEAADLAGAGWVDPAGRAAPGVGPTGAGLGLDATREAGTFDEIVSPSSVGRASGDNDALGTLADDPEPSLPSDAGLGGSRDFDAEEDEASRPGGAGGRDGGL